MPLVCGAWAIVLGMGCFGVQPDYLTISNPLIPPPPIVWPTAGHPGAGATFDVLLVSRRQVDVAEVGRDRLHRGEPGAGRLVAAVKVAVALSPGPSAGTEAITSFASAGGSN